MASVTFAKRKYNFRSAEPRRAMAAPRLVSWPGAASPAPRMTMALFAPLPEDTLRIPARAHRLAGFREWAYSEDFPEHERIDFLGGEVEVETSPEDLQSHGALKAEIAAVLHDDQGWSPSAGLGVQVRLRRDVDTSGLWFFPLETRPER